ncbi:hypothetical protein HAX54_007567 [Datura stramonium]|uniref:Uncharacterized protein n=1 Tax=Datura stramonium TaxID=4076 RepID=A0ABS8TDL3_DATST|nr:hypothetical protein [Datura stramonium]
MLQQPLRHFGPYWITGKKAENGLRNTKELKYSHELFIDKLYTLGIVDRLHTLGLGFLFNDRGECNLNMMRHQGEGRGSGFLARYDPKGIDVMKPKDLEGIHGLVPHRVGPGFKEPLDDDDDATDEEQARSDYDLEFDDYEDDSSMGEATLAPTNNDD